MTDGNSALDVQQAPGHGLAGALDKQTLAGTDDGLQAIAQQLIGWFAAAEQPYVVALSGGVDSAVVAKAAALSKTRTVVVTARSPSLSGRELLDAQAIGRDLGLVHQIIHTAELLDPNYRQNDGRRCYYCKSELFTSIRSLFPDAVVVTGTNADDLQDYRPGLVAAREALVRAPLAELGITKTVVRRLAALWGLAVADKPASPCLASRIAHGVTVTEQRLAMVEQAEDVMRSLGLVEFRVRLHAGELARIEVSPAALAHLVDERVRQRVTSELQRIGFRYVTLDLQGFRSGSLNPVFGITPP